MKCQKELDYSWSTIHKLMIGTQKLDEIISSTKSSRHKKRLGFERDSSTIITSSITKFIKLIVPGHKLNFITTAPKGKSVVVSLPLTSAR